MDWREVTIYTTTEGIGPVEALLEDNGVEGYVLEDAADFEEFLKDTEIYWDYVDEDLVREKRAQETCLKIYLPDSDEGGPTVYRNRADPSGGLGVGMEAVFQTVPGGTQLYDQTLVGDG